MSIPVFGHKRQYFFHNLSCFFIIFALFLTVEQHIQRDDNIGEAFDEEGFFRTGDKVSLVDAEDPNKGLRFDGRIAEEFKLTTGIWVPASDLRLEVLAALAPLAADVVLTGEGRGEVGAMIIPSPALAQGLHAYAGACHPGDQAAEIAKRLSRLNAGRGSATTIARALILSDPPSMADGEVTAKGNLNFRKILLLRADLVSRLHEDPDETVIFVH